ncbi:uncharacterized protein [Diadema setosum]|uniref:uncharacterized protein n=1 Tax=Diadema setosum TaxID=31175 RepID=UPI003B3AACED
MCAAMDPQNQYFYGRSQGPSMQQDPSFPVNDLDHSKMGPMMRALTEDFDVLGQNSSGYPQQGMSSMPGSGDHQQQQQQHQQQQQQQQRLANNFGPASQTLSGYASQYSSGPSSQSYFGHGHPSSPLNSGFSPPGANYSGGMGSPYQRQMSNSSSMGSSNGHGHSYPRSASAGPTIPSPIMMHGPGMYPHSQSSPANRSTTPFGFPTSPTSPHNHMNHASPPLASPSSMRPGGNLHSPKSLPASSPVPFASQMSPTSSRAQSVPTLPGNSIDHVPAMPHSRSKSPGSAGVHRPYPQPPGQQPQQLYPLPSPKVRPVDQTDGRGQYVELVHSKPSGDQWNQKSRQGTERSRNNSGHTKVSDPGHLPRLEEMVAVLGESNAKESLDQIVSDNSSMLHDSQTNGSLEVNRTVATSLNPSHASNEKRTQVICEKVNSTDKVEGRLANGVGEKDEMPERKDSTVNGPAENSSEKDSSVKRVTKANCGKVSTNPNGRTDTSQENDVGSTNGTNSESSVPFKPPKARQTKTKNTDQTKDTQNVQEGHKNTGEPHKKLGEPCAPPETKCQKESTDPKHSSESQPAKPETPPSTHSELSEKTVSPPTPANETPTTTPTSKRKQPEEGESSTGDDSLPLKKRRGRPPGTKNKPKKDGEEAKPKRKYTKKKKSAAENNAEEEATKSKQSKPMVKGKAEVTPAVARGPIVRVQGTSIDSIISSQVVNSPGTEEEQAKGSKKKVKQVKRQSVLAEGPAGQAAVLASEPRSPTGLWVCSLCGNPANFGVLGDLYGPYHPPGSTASCSQKESGMRHERGRGSDPRKSHLGSRGVGAGASTSDKSHSLKGRSQRGKSLLAKQANPAKIRKWRQINTYMEEMSLSRGKRRLSQWSQSDSEDEVPELWVHEECAVWAQGVFFLHGTLYGIHEAVKAAATKKCNLCRDPGASIGCLSKGCKQVYHYLCAMESECQMHLDNFSMTCPKHKDKKVKMRGET